LRLSRWLHSNAPAIVVGDITDLERIDSPGHGQVTSRAQLRDILGALAKCRPRSIGVDIDFSKENNEWLHPDDLSFLEYCLTLQDPDGHVVPVFVGADRSLGCEPKDWLGGERFQRLAVSMRVPADEDHTTVLAWFRAAGISTPLPTMSAALAPNFKRDAERLQRLPRLFASATVDEHGEPKEFEAAQFYVDTSPLSELRDHRVVLRDAASVELNAHRFQGKIVLLAKVGSEDKILFSPSGEREAAAYLHACGANTIVEQPLLQLRPLAEIGLDLLLSVLVLGAVAWMRTGYERVPGRRVPVTRLHVVFTLVAVVSVLCAGVVWIAVFRIIWLGFLVVAAGLVVHLALSMLVHGLEHGSLAHAASGPEANRT